MSAMRHATISVWQRHEDGGYGADRNGWSLRVKWHPESPDGSRGFSWEAEQGSNKLASDELFEEIEVAMAQAEEQVAADPATTAGDPRAAALGDRHVPH
jgi:hypothetical protein